MIYLRLFLNFLMIGALSFGGGYGMVSLVRETVLSNGWLTENEFLNFIAVSESTPGPLAVNMATFIGSTQGGILGSFAATLGVVLPSFLIILLIASALKNLIKYAPVNAFLCSQYFITSGPNFIYIMYVSTKQVRGFVYRRVIYQLRMLHFNG